MRDLLKKEICVRGSDFGYHYKWDELPVDAKARRILRRIKNKKARQSLKRALERGE